MASLDAMPLTQYYTASTLDGFIAGPDDSLEWLFTREQDHDGPLNYKAFIADVGVLAMGRTTYDWVFGHDLGASFGEEVECRELLEHPDRVV